MAEDFDVSWFELCRGGMESMEPVFFRLAFAFALPGLTSARSVCKMQIQAQENEKLFIPCVDACVCICVGVIETCKSLYLHRKACVCTYICVARLKQAFAFSSKSHTCLNEAKYSFVRF